MKAWLESLGLSLLAVFAPVNHVIATVGALVLADLVLGVWAAKKRNEQITSAGFRRSLTKALVYETAVMLGFIVETYLLGGSVPVVKLIASLIGLTEIKSVLESLDTINGEPLFKSLIVKLGSNNDVK